MFKKISVILLTVLVLAASAFAVRPWNNYVQTAPRNQVEPLYRNLPEGATVSEISISGIVKEIELIPGEGIKVVVEAEGKEYEVHTGPIRLYEGLKEGINIEIIGRKVELGDNTYIVVYKAVIEGKEIVIRENGFPVFTRKGGEVSRGNAYSKMGRKNVRGRNINNSRNNVRTHVHGRRK
ncbi:hypothetical protein XJ44_03430 [Thermosipho affectus]|uniref:DNA-binding protein n=1 Tax=Thermosipho affectus TaxID=660294 RepID=A0ABX3ILI1_9BACT|nr:MULTISPECIES: hypothetical protein [Thermosipho]ANQ53562.1 hypothetical protein Y592_03570 [Thermosipho sp. 1070]APT72010.1 hypothetical protein BG95_03520 [Thermosipho sp. 1063]ONN27493.1 hypothetical protein XJ44_03430 [Thermosipho affectus]OOC44391.1 hypothetical protein XO08_03480 [Thermosipho sp. 1074]